MKAATIVAVSLLTACAGTSTMPRGNVREAANASTSAQPFQVIEPSIDRRPPWKRPPLIVPLTAPAAAVNNAGVPRVVAVSDFSANMIDIFSETGQLALRITDGLNGPQGLALDASGNLYVANTSDQDILIFPPNSFTATRKLNVPGGFPVSVTVAPDGTVYTADWDGTDGSTGAIAVFPPGATYPSSKIIDRHLPPQYLTTDKDGNLFVDQWDPQGVGRVVEYAGGKAAAIKRLPIELSWPGGLHITPTGTLLCVDAGLETVTEYTKAGVPTGRSIHTIVFWGDVAIGKSNFGSQWELVGGSNDSDDNAEFPYMYLRTFPDGIQHLRYFDHSFHTPGGGVVFMPGKYSY